MGSLTPAALQREVLRLKKQGVSQRKIKAQTGVCRATVGIICRRGHVVYKTTPNLDDDNRISLGVGKCPTCHALVDLPCRACATLNSEAYRQRDHAEPEPPAPKVKPLGLELEPRDRARYEMVRDWIMDQVRKYGPTHNSWEKYPDW